MKKNTLLLATAFAVSGAFAQDLTSKKGEPILPEANDWAIGIEASPFLGYIGNAFNGSLSNSSPSWGFLNTNQTIVGKLFKDEKTAYRGILRIGFNSNKSTAMIADATVTTPPVYPALPTMVEDSWKTSSNYIGLGAGMEMRRGKTRLQGFYGADAMLWMSGSKNKYTYGNALSSTVSPGAGTTTDFGNNLSGVTDTYSNSARVIEQKNGTTIGLGVRAFIGAEYFILPKISISGDFGWGLGFSTTGEGSRTVESVDSGTGAAGTQTLTTGKSSDFSLDVNRDAFGTGNGSLRLNLHF